ncbi:MAG: helix-turn-helix domain-containing protein [Flavobacterium sp.]
MTNDRVCAKIKKIRLEKNLTQEYVAEQLNISQSYYAKIENGKKELTLNLLFNISKVLNADTTFLVKALNE